MSISFKLILSCFLVVIITSCSPKMHPFTQDMYDRYAWNEDDLKSIQFYLSREVVLRRSKSRGASEIVDGKIKDLRDRKVQEVIIPAKTPGVLVFLPKSNRFGISFEQSGNQKFLMFGPNPKSGGKYVLLAQEWKNRKGKITYDSETYITELGASFSHLLVNVKKAHKIGIRSSVVRGRTVN
ncbi:MAG: hypothetical protein KJP00_02965 [Bacteroidia bacterium]|nr:hypothetical protein [Bacteroidia bacterium]